MAISLAENKETPPTAGLLQTRRIKPLLLAHFLSNFAFYLTAPIIPFLAERLDAEQVESAAIVTFQATCCAVRLLAGFLCKAYPYRGIKQVGLVACTLLALSFVCYTLADDGMEFVGCRVLHGAAYGAAGPAIMGYMARIVPSQFRRPGHAAQSAVGNLAMAVGTWLSLMMVAKGWLLQLLVLGVMAGVISFIVLYVVPAPAPLLSGAEKNIASMKWTEVLKAVAPLAFVLCIVLIFTAGVTTYIEPLAKERGYWRFAAPFYMGLNAVVIMLCALLLIWNKKWNKLIKLSSEKLVTISFSSFVVGIIGLSINSLPLFLMAAVANGIGSGLLSSVLRDRAMKFIPSDSRPLAISFFYTIVEVGAMLCFINGELSKTLGGYQYALPLVGCVCIGLGAVISFIYMRHPFPAQH